MSIVILSSLTNQFSPSERLDLFEIMRDAYTRTEAEMWGENWVRMPQSEYEDLIDEGKISAALIDGKVVGTIYLRRVDVETASFGLLATHRDYGSLGIGRALIESVENDARIAGAKYMDLDILRPRDFKLPIKDRLRNWYEGMGYEFTHSQDFQEDRPDYTKYLTTPLVLDTYRKALI